MLSLGVNEPSQRVGLAGPGRRPRASLPENRHIHDKPECRLSPANPAVSSWDTRQTCRGLRAWEKAMDETWMTTQVWETSRTLTEAGF